MQKSILFKTAAIGAFALAGAAYGQTCDKTFDGSTNNNWDVDANWTPSGVPDADDRVCIPADKTCEVNITGALADTIEIDPDDEGSVCGKLIILDGKVLTLDNSEATPENHVVRGTIDIRGTGILFFDANDHTVTGGANDLSTIFGSNSDSSKIQIDAGQKLTIDSNMTISGRLKIQSDTTTDATFRNEGLVLADVVSGVLELGPYVALEDTSGGPRWKATGSTSISFGELKFSNAHTTVCPSLTGDFLINTYGKLNFDQSIYSLGGFTCTGNGTVAGTLRYAYNCEAGTWSDAASCP